MGPITQSPEVSHKYRMHSMKKHQSWSNDASCRKPHTSRFRQHKWKTSCTLSNVSAIFSSKTQKSQETKCWERTNEHPFSDIKISNIVHKSKGTLATEQTCVRCYRVHTIPFLPRWQVVTGLYSSGLVEHIMWMFRVEKSLLTFHLLRVIILKRDTITQPPTDMKKVFIYLYTNVSSWIAVHAWSSLPACVKHRYTHRVQTSNDWRSLQVAHFTERIKSTFLCNCKS